VGGRQLDRGRPGALEAERQVDGGAAGAEVAA
jgi:hypothetical protein